MWSVNKKFEVVAGEMEAIREDVAKLKAGGDDRFVECEVCGCVLFKSSAHEVAELGWKSNTTIGRSQVPKNAVEVTEEWSSLGVYYKYKTPIAIQKYYCKIHKPKRGKKK